MNWKKSWTGSLLALGILSVAAAQEAPAQELRNHGVAVPVCTSCGTVATSNSAGERLVLSLNSDSSGCHQLLVVNVDTGKSLDIPLDGTPESVDMRPFSSLLSTRNRYYAVYGGRFFEVDPDQLKVTFSGKVSGQLGMGMTEDDNGVIWAASYPGSQLCSYDPATGKLTDYGPVHQEDWPQYQRYVAADDAGWIYFGVGTTEPQIVAFHPATRESRTIIPEADRGKASTGQVERAADGKVYGWIRRKNTPYFVLHNGKAERLEKKPVWTPAAGAVTGSQFLVHRDFPKNGGKLKDLDLIERKLTVTEPDGKERELPIDYASKGVYIMSMAALPDGTVRGAAMHPMRYFIFDTGKQAFTGTGNAVYQWNALQTDGTHLFVGGYGNGALLDWDITKPFTGVEKKPHPNDNPYNFGEATPEIHRPSYIVLMPDQRTLVMAGTPGYGRTGGGLVLADRERRSMRIIPQNRMMSPQSVNSLLPLSEKTLLCGGTVTPGTGGRTIAKEAELGIFDLEKEAFIWRGKPVAGVKSYYSMLPLADGKVLIAADLDKLLVFDPAKRTLEKNIAIEPLEMGRMIWQQGPRMLQSDGKRILVLMERGVAEFLPESGTLRKLTDVPKRITSGGTVSGGRIYFACGPELWSYRY